MRKGRYCLGRIVKINLDQQELMDSITNAPIITIGKFDWTITDVFDNRYGVIPYVFGKLSKYARDGHAKVIDELSRAQIDADVPNLLEASSPFVYLPEYSGIAFLHVSTGIQEHVFPRRFKSVIEAAFDGIMVSCDVQTISDYHEFTTRLKKLNYFTEFSATVFPPNPLFGRLWGNLNKYIDSRNASEITVKEHASNSEGLKSNVVELMDKIIESPDYEPDEVPAIGDSAILMAADGYGKGKVVGVEGNGKVTLKTSETQKNFLHDKESEPNELAIKANFHFDKTSKERDMKH